MKTFAWSAARGLGLAALMLTATLQSAVAAESSYSCSVTQGFNFQKDSQQPIGHINSLKIGDVEMLSDLTVTDPMNVASTVKVFGIASGIQWKGGYADPVTFVARVSVNNKNKLATLRHKSMANTEVEVQFTIYDYDPRTKSYYKAFHTNGMRLKGLVLKQGGELAMNIDMNQNPEVVSPKNHAFQLGVMPWSIAQEIHLAFSSTDRLVKRWGVAVGR